VSERSAAIREAARHLRRKANLKAEAARENAGQGFYRVAADLEAFAAHLNKAAEYIETRPK
jgi:hypothetical protein